MRPRRGSGLSWVWGVLLAAVTIVACSSESGAVAPPTAAETATVVSVTETAIPSTIPSPTATPEPLPTGTHTPPAAQVVEVCPTVPQVTPFYSLAYFGDLALLGWDAIYADAVEGYWLQSLRGRERILVPDIPGQTTVTLSPDGRWLAFSRYVGSTKQIWVGEMPEGNRFQVDTLGLDVFYVRWTRDNQLVLYVVVDIPRGEPVSWPAAVVDPFSAQAERLPPPVEGYYWKLIDPDPLTKMAIVVLDEPGADTWALYDIRSGELKRLFPVQGSMLSAWSPNGRMVAFADNGLRIYEAPHMMLWAEPLRRGPDVGYTVVNLSWSPDGSQLAFQLYWWAEEARPGEPEAGVYVYDLQSHTLRYYCWDLENLTDFAWSPDGHYLAVYTDEPPVIYLLEVATGRRTGPEIGGLGLVGWSYLP